MSFNSRLLTAGLAGIVATVGLLAADVAEARRDPYRGDYSQRQAVKRAYVAGAIHQHRRDDWQREEWRREREYERERERRRDQRAIVGAVIGAAVVGAAISNARD